MNRKTENCVSKVTTWSFFVLVLLFVGCSIETTIKQPLKKSSTDTGADLKKQEIKAWFKGEKEYQDLSDAAQRDYIKNQTFYESLRLLTCEYRVLYPDIFFFCDSIFNFEYSIASPTHSSTSFLNTLKAA
jgi:hypothetical protein